MTLPKIYCQGCKAMVEPKGYKNNQSDKSMDKFSCPTCGRDLTPLVHNLVRALSINEKKKTT